MNLYDRRRERCAFELQPQWRDYGSDCRTIIKPFNDKGSWHRRHCFSEMPIEFVVLLTVICWALYFWPWTDNAQQMFLKRLSFWEIQKWFVREILQFCFIYLILLRPMQIYTVLLVGHDAHPKDCSIKDYKMLLYTTVNKFVIRIAYSRRAERYII